MQKSIRATVNQMFTDKKGRKQTRLIVLTLMMVVMFMVYYFLASPAMTMEKQLQCGLEEHVHTAECYGEPVQICDPESEGGIQEKTLTCGLTETATHEHGDDCYDEEGNLICLEDAFVAHVHTDECADDCDLPTEPHEHDEFCYTVSGGHTHSEDCWQQSIICGHTEHTHVDACYVEQQSLSTNNYAANDSIDPGIIHTDLMNNDVMLDTVDAEDIETEYSSELVDFLKEAKLYRLTETGREEVKDGIVNVDESYIFTLKFEEKSIGLQFAYDEKGVLTYQLPANLKISEIQSGTIYANGNREAGIALGTYQIELNGVVTVSFFDVDMNGIINEDGTNFIDLYNNVTFFLDVEATFVMEENISYDKIEFADGVDIVISTGGEAELLVEKECVRYNYKTHTLEYKVVVQAVNGAVSNIELLDQILLTASSTSSSDYSNYLDLPATMKITYPDGTTDTLAVTEIETTTIAEMDPTNAEKMDPTNAAKYRNVTVRQFGVTLPADPADFVLDVNKTITLEYEVQVTDEAYVARMANPPSFYALNVVTADGKDPEKNDISADDRVIQSISRTLMSKSGAVVTTEDGKKLIKWTIYAGDGYYDLSGQTLTDTLGIGHSYYVNPDDTKYGQLTIIGRSIDADSKSSDLLPKITGWENVNIIDNADGTQSFTYVFPDNADLFPERDPETYAYTFIFYTELSDTVAPPAGKYQNTIKTELYHGETSVTASVSIVSVDATVKKANCIVGDYIEYTITLDVPATIFGKKFYISDTLSAYYSSTTYNAYNNPKDMTITVTSADGQPVDNSVFNWNIVENHGGSAAKFLVYVNGATASANSLWPLNYDSKVTITYNIPLSAKIINNEQDTLSDVLSNGDFYKTSTYVRNSITAQFDSVSLSATSTTYPYLHKTGKWNSETQTADYEVFLNSNQKLNPAGVTQAEVAAVNNGTAERNFQFPLFIDEYDERMEYVQGTFQIDVFSSKADVPDKPSASYHYTEAQIRAYEAQTGKTYLWFEDGKIIFDTSFYYDKGPSMWWPHSASYITRFGYSLKAKDTVQEIRFEADNTATVHRWIKDQETIYKSTETVVVGDKVIDKDMVVATGGKTAAVNIEINKNGIDLKSTTDLIKVIDTMSSNLALYINTLQLQAYDTAAEAWGAPITLTESNTEEAYTYILNSEDNSITLFVPDNIHFKLTYTVLVKANAGEDVNISNSVRIDGYSACVDSVEHSYQVTDSSAGAGASSVSFTIFKRDEKQSTIALKDAKFALYGPKYTGWTSATATAANVAATKVIDGTTYYFYETVTTTGNNGAVTSTHERLAVGYVYALVELEAPVGYHVLTAPKLFTFTSLPAGADKDKVEVISDNITIYNSTGYVLPATGGTGTTPYVIGGLLIMSLAGFMVIRKRKGGVSAAEK